MPRLPVVGRAIQLRVVRRAIQLREEYESLVHVLVQDVVDAYTLAQREGHPYHADTLEVWLAMTVQDVEIAQRIREALAQ